MDNVAQKQVLCQCLDLVPFDKVSSLEYFMLDHGMKKLSTVALVKVFIAAQLKGWSSYTHIEEGLRGNKLLCNQLGISSISGSQLSRRIANLPTELLQELFAHVVQRVQSLTGKRFGVSTSIGRLNIVDSTSLTLPLGTHSWAHATKRWTGVKMHTRLIVADPDITLPDKIIPSTGNVSDQRGSDELVVESDATYVMDRGYVSYKRMDKWIEAGINYVLRINEKHQANIQQEHTLPESSRIVRDAEVLMGSSFIQMQHPVRLVEFLDEQGQVYRVVTTRRDLSAVEISEIYRHR